MLCEESFAVCITNAAVVAAAGVVDVDVLPHVVDSIRFLLKLFSLGVFCFVFFLKNENCIARIKTVRSVSWVGASWVRHSDKINREMKFAHAHAIFDAYLIFFDVINSGQCHIKCAHSKQEMESERRIFFCEF